MAEKVPADGAGFVVLAASIVLLALPGAAAAVLTPPTAHRVGPPAGAAGFGASVAGLGDVDGDGAGDVVVGAPGSGHVYVVSGATGAILHDIADPAGGGSNFGFSVAGIGDVDGDGVSDLAVGAPSASGPAAGRVLLFSGATGGLLRQLTPATGDRPAFGHSVAGAGDLSGDGVPDVVVAAPAVTPGLAAVVAFSGADGAQLWSRLEPTVPAEERTFGQTVVITPDVSGDGVADILVSAPSVSNPSSSVAAGGDLITGALTAVLGLVTRVVTSPPAPGRVYLLSGVDGAVLRSMADPAARNGSAFGAAVAPVGDQDGDGVVDHLVGAAGASRLHLYSGRDGRLVRSVAAPGTVAGQGVLALAPAGDQDGDGRNDVWVGVASERAAYLVNAMGTLLASSASRSPQGSFGAAIAATGNGVIGGGADLVVGDPTEPGGGAAYLLQTSPDAPAAANEGAVRHAGCTAVNCENLVRAQGQAPTSTTALPAATTVPTATSVATTTIPTDAMPSTATLPKPASAAASESALPSTGGGQRFWAGMLLLVLGAAGVSALRRHRTPSPHGDQGSAR
ncbi:MAG TPA: integrin alpha [Egibacteraceae bacterium]|nr:integrin alpha [Egibacteraceae bacterium]